MTLVKMFSFMIIIDSTDHTSLCQQQQQQHQRQQQRPQRQKNL